MSKSYIYLDYAAATPIDRSVLRAMNEVASVFGNPSSIHAYGREAKKKLNESRASIARILGARPSDIIFTASGTEADNLALIGYIAKRQIQKTHIITTKIEHHAILRACEALRKAGHTVTYLNVGPDGRVRPDDVKHAITKSTALVSIHYANNEIGVIQPLREIAAVIREYRRSHPEQKILFHTDACQAAGILDIHTGHLGVDAMTISGAKIYGPKGIGVLYLHRSFDVAPVLVGGSQERGRRAGTENLMAIVGMATALERAQEVRIRESKKMVRLRDALMQAIERAVPDNTVHGSLQERLPGNLNISFKDTDGELLVLELDREGFGVSTGAACTTTTTEPSHVIEALYGKKGVALCGGNIRITLGRSTTKRDLERFSRSLVKSVSRLRRRFLSSSR